METTYQKIEKIAQLISELNSDILVCSGSLGSVLQDSVLFDFASGNLDNETILNSHGEKYKIGNFFNKKDIFIDPYMKNEKQLIESRRKILDIADYVIPGHGKMFKVEK